MTEVLRLSKLDAAQRQLDRAIRMLFERDDPVCSHTLAGAASVVLADLVQHRFPGKTWEHRIQEDTNLGQQEYF